MAKIGGDKHGRPRGRKTEEKDHCAIETPTIKPTSCMFVHRWKVV